jgi:ubiquinol-cytochrome c reductase cytochrome c1 subunit
MPPPLTSDGQVNYADGTKATVPQMAKDVGRVPELDRRSRSWKRVTRRMFDLIYLHLPDGARLSRLSQHSGRTRSIGGFASTGPLDPENIAQDRQATGEAGVIG